MSHLGRILSGEKKRLRLRSQDIETGVIWGISSVSLSINNGVDINDLYDNVLLLKKFLMLNMCAHSSFISFFCP